jgi:hypothetical protein
MPPASCRAAGLVPAIAAEDIRAKRRNTDIKMNVK